MREYAEFRTRDFWAAAFLLVNGVPLLRAEVDWDGRARFFFDNAEGHAARVFTDWQAGDGRDLAPIQAFRTAYRSIQHAADQVKEAHRYAVPTERR